MTGEKVKEVLDKYESRLQVNGFKPIRGADKAHLFDRINHLTWMCIEARSFVDQGRLEKAMRWLGFIQGAFWAFCLDTVENMKLDNTPEPSGSWLDQHDYNAGLAHAVQHIDPVAPGSQTYMAGYEDGLKRAD